MAVNRSPDGVWLHTSERATTTTTVLALGEQECLVVDPAMEPSDLDEIAAMVRARVDRDPRMVDPPTLGPCPVVVPARSGRCQVRHAPERGSCARPS